MKDDDLNKNKGCTKNILIGVFGTIVFLSVAGLFIYIFWYRPNATNPISEPIQLPTRIPPAEIKETGIPNKPSAPPTAPLLNLPTARPEEKPVCGEDPDWLFLLVGIDYRGEGYLYGLADVIRVVRVDFIDMKINMVALPRDLVVEVPESFTNIPSPLKINQAYLFGTQGMDHYAGSGYGAGALAEVIQYNFGITPDHYGVINFETFIRLIDAIGGIEVDLPGAVLDDEFGNFPAGQQILNGQRALSLVRIRKNYGDNFRVNNQTLVLQGILNQLLKPSVMLKIPKLLKEFTGTFLTDLSIDQIRSTGFCFINNFKGENLNVFQPPNELLAESNMFIPTLNDNAFVYRWDHNFVEWLFQSLIGE